MSTSTALGVAATMFGVAMGLSPLLQLRTVVTRRSSDDVSIAYLCILLVGFVLWLAYGLALGNAALIVSNAVALSAYGATTLVVLRYRTTRIS
jgi:MtN3 and saliva related transmembrane protein